MYESPFYKYVATVGWLMIPLGVLYFLKRIFERELGFLTLVIMLVILGTSLYFLVNKYFKKERKLPDANLRDWQWLMFWAIFTHPLLDCFTTYGTQLFQPFSDYRVSFNVISVADPLYTVPFLICIIATSFYARTKTIRRKLAWTGLAISSLYMCICIYNKQRINYIWRNTLAVNNVKYSRIMSSPSIFNNILWSCVAETEEGYMTGQYSFFDSSPIIEYKFTPRLPEELSATPDHPTIDCMRWFSNDFYSIIMTESGYQFNDLRFGTIDIAGSEHYIFNFPIKENSPGNYEMLKTNGGPPPGAEQEMMGKLVERIKGI